MRLLQEFQTAQRQRQNELETPVCSATYPDEEIQEPFDGNYNMLRYENNQLKNTYPLPSLGRRHWKDCASLWDIRDSGHCNSWVCKFMQFS